MELSLGEIIVDELFREKLNEQIREQHKKIEAARIKYGKIRRTVWERLDDNMNLFSCQKGVDNTIDHWLLCMNKKSPLSSYERTGINYLCQNALTIYLKTKKPNEDAK